MTKFFVRSAYNYDTEAASNEAAIPPELTGESLTVQSMADDADINILMKRYGILGKFPENPRLPSYGDFSHITDFRSALEAVRAADDAFMEYPGEFRARFDNDPQKFLDFCENPANINEMVQLGIAKWRSNENISGAVGNGGVAGGATPPAGSTPGGATAGGAGVSGVAAGASQANSGGNR